MQPSDAEIDAHLRAILESPEFQEQATDRIVSWLTSHIELLESLLDWGGYWLLAAVLLGLLLLVFLARSGHRFERGLSLGGAKGEGARAGPGADVSPDGLLAHATALADAGSLRDAALALQHALLLDGCRRRSLIWRPALSDWEWLRLLEPSAALVELTRTTQRLAFGPAPDRAVFDACRERAHTLLSARGSVGKAT